MRALTLKDMETSFVLNMYKYTEFLHTRNVSVEGKDYFS